MTIDAPWYCLIDIKWLVPARRLGDALGECGAELLGDVMQWSTALAARKPATVMAILVAGLLFSVTVPAAQAVVDKTVYRCDFSDGQVRTIENGAFKRVGAKDISFRIGNIDLVSQTAQLLTENGSDQLRIVRAINANHFLEVVTEGFLNMTTIYEPMVGQTRSPAVHSRHFGLLGEPVVTQYTGFCAPVSN